MNRPFYAFGLLLALLALAMVAVSSTGPTTTVQSTPPAAGSLLTPAPSRGTIFVLVMPAPEENEIESQGIAVLQPCRIVPVSPCRPITPTSVQLVPAMPCCGPTDKADCLSHYDPAYDALVYGPYVLHATRSESLSDGLGSPHYAGASAEEELALLASFLPPRSLAVRIRTAQPTQTGATWRIWWERVRSQIPNDPALWRGMQNWAFRPLQRWASRPAATPTIDGSDNSDEN